MLMVAARKVPLEIVGYGKAHGTGVAEVVSYDRMHRMGRAVRILAICWLAALVTAFMPLWHILLVPLLIALGIFFFVVRVRAPEVARSVEGICPDCGRKQRFDVPVRWELPLDVECVQCSRNLTLNQHYEAQGT